MEPFVFDWDLAIEKPKTMHQKTAYCPFCHRDELTNILAEEGPILWLMNKYPVYENIWATVIIETYDCEGEFSTLPLDHAEHIIRFMLTKWRELKENPKFASVLCYKNYGPFSGGSIYHPHSQIIGLEKQDVTENIKKAHFDGPSIFKNDELEITLSAHPLLGPVEFNLVGENTLDFRTWAEKMQDVLSYITKDYFGKFTPSYNYYFYDLHDGKTYCKIIPRRIVNPISVGYKITEVMTAKKQAEIIEELRKRLR